MNLLSILLAVVIIAMLSVYSIRTWYSPSETKETGETAIEQAYDTQKMSDLRAIETAIMAYHTTNYKYPDSLSDLIPQYASSIPVDPETGDSYGYKKTSSGYKLYCKLDDKEKMKNDGGSDPGYYEIGNDI